MKKQFVIAALPLLFTASTTAQSLADLPVCAQSAALAGITSTGCNVDDIACVCQATPFFDGLRNVIVTACSPGDQARALAFAQQLCSSVGVSIDAPPIIESSSMADTPSSTSMAMSTSSSTMDSPSATDASRTAETTSASMSTSSETSSSETITMTISGSMTMETSAPQFTGAAPGMVRAPLLAAAVVGAVGPVIAAL